MTVSNNPGTEEPSGIKTIYADKTDSYRVEYVKDVVYDVRDGLVLHLQILYPRYVPQEVLDKQMPDNPNPLVISLSQPNPRYPLIVYVQGSAWMQQDCYKTLPLFVEFARMGYVVASVEYRPSSVAPWPGYILDVKGAIRYLRTNAELYGIDRDRVAIWGCSSGGNAALLVGTTGWTREFDDALCPDESSAVNAVVDFYGPTDIPKIFDLPRDDIAKAIRPSPEDILFRCNTEEHPEATAPANPMNYVFADRPCPPMLIVHGDEDGVVPFSQSVLMYNKLVECGKRVEFFNVSGAGHGTFLWTKEVMQIVGKFLEETLRQPAGE